MSRQELLNFDREYERTYWSTMRRKLGLGRVEEEADKQLANQLFQVSGPEGVMWPVAVRCRGRLPAVSGRPLERPLTRLTLREEIQRGCTFSSSPMLFEGHVHF